MAVLDVNDPMPGTGRTVAEALMEPHISYAKLMQVIMRTVEVRGMAHITGGGITDNLPRILPEGVAAEINLESWIVPPLFRFLKEAGNVDDKEMLRTFNMGQGFLFVVPAEQADRAKETIELAGQSCSFAGKIIEGEGKVHYSGSLNYADTSD